MKRFAKVLSLSCSFVDFVAKKHTENTHMSSEETQSKDFIRAIIADDLAAGRHKQIVTRFPPEPNGYLHIGHAKSICLNFGIAKENTGARCHLRFDDTNPTKEEQEYVESIKDNVRWLGFDWDTHLYFASDYFEQIYQYAEHLITTSKAYVCDLSAEDTRSYRGTLTEPGKNSPYRDRSVEENLDLFRRMRAGEFPDGARVLRAKIDMASGNMNMRDPVLYRILHASHHRTGNTWCIYPMYDYTHPISDALEGITHSLCTLEFADHRPLYDWTLDNLPVDCHPRQIEFARLNLSYTVVSKRKLLQLVNEGHVSGWDDPRMPTVQALRRRGIRPEALRKFMIELGVGETDISISMDSIYAENRKIVDPSARRRFFVKDPVPLEIDGNVPVVAAAPFHPTLDLGLREIPAGPKLLVSADDLSDLKVGASLRLKDLCNIEILSLDPLRARAIGTDPHQAKEMRLRIIHWAPPGGVPVRVMRPDGVDSGIGEVGIGEDLDRIVQFERYGFVRIDSVSEDGVVAYFAHR